MGERSSSWVRKVSAHAALVVGAALLAGCGAYNPEPEFPQQSVDYVAPPPPSATDLAAQEQARASESAEVVIGADTNEDEYPDTDPSALTEFKPALDDHGTWVEDSSYGTVWVPAATEVGADFQPYVSAGHWSYSDATDYVWVSDYSWGWAPFHYGRWVNLPHHGWSWIPGRRYAGAWVTWRTGPAYDYVGWAPAPPSWYWYQGAAYGWSFGWYDYHQHYVYCPRDYVYRGPTYVVRGPAAREHFGRTQDYVPASPTVAPRGGGPGDRIVASPSVGGRVIASPTVGGVAGARVGARGPRPSEMGVGNDLVVAPPTTNAGLERARTYASPRTAVVAGGAAPASFGGDVGSRGPATAAFVPSVASRPVASSGVGSSPSFSSRSASPSFNGRAAAPSVGDRTASSFRPSPSVSTPSRAPTSTPSFAPASRPTVSARPSIGSQPVTSFRSSPSVSAPSRPTVSAPVRSTPSVGSRSVSSTPSRSVSSSPSRSVATPSRSSGSSSVRKR